KDVSVIVWGEFGRTPRINKDASRDHWPQLSCALLAGGGMRTGQAIGASNRLAEHATQRPVTHQQIFATLYRNLRIDLNPIRDHAPAHPRAHPPRPPAAPRRAHPPAHPGGGGGVWEAGRRAGGGRRPLAKNLALSDRITSSRNRLPGAI